MTFALPPQWSPTCEPPRSFRMPEYLKCRGGFAAEAGGQDATLDDNSLHSCH